MKNKKRIFLTLSLFAIAIAAGIVQYSFGPIKFDGGNLADAFSNKKNAAFGEAVLVGNVDATPVVSFEVGEKEQEDDDKEQDIEDKEQKETEQNEKEKDVIKNNESAFEQAKIERDQMRSRSREQLEAAVAASSDTIVSSEAQQSLLELTETENLESKVESLLSQKGYKQTMVYIGTDDSMDIVVNSKNITSADAAGIADTASRHSGIDVGDIVIKCLK